MPLVFSNNTKTSRFNMGLDSVRNIRNSVSHFCKLYAFKKSLFCNFYKTLCFRTNIPNRECSASITVKAVFIGYHINTYNVAIFQYSVIIWYSMHYNIINRCAA